MGLPKIREAFAAVPTIKSSMGSILGPLILGSYHIVKEFIVASKSLRVCCPAGISFPKGPCSYMVYTLPLK